MREYEQVLFYLGQSRGVMAGPSDGQKPFAERGCKWCWWDRDKNMETLGPSSG